MKFVFYKCLISPATGALSWRRHSRDTDYYSLNAYIPGGGAPRNITTTEPDDRRCRDELLKTYVNRRFRRTKIQ